MDAQQQNVIFRKYGDYLYQKADYDGAMQQYLKAIDNTEPSQVIRKVWLALTIIEFCTDPVSISIHNEYII
jgi:Tfp pilus assembly protein PilF